MVVGFGLVLNMIVFIVPGLVVGAIGRWVQQGD